MNDAIFSQIDFGPLTEFLNDDDITDISYSNNGQVWLKTLSKGVYQVERPDINNPFMEKLAFQCSNVMGKTFNMAHPFLDSESAELRMNFVHDSIATNGIAVLIRKTPAKIRLNKEKLIDEDYVTENVHDFLIKCVQGHCNIIVAGETGSGKTELVKYLASHTAENEKLITIEDTLELHLDRIFPHRDIVAMKTNNIASYSDVLVTCMRQNPKWILLSEVRSAEAVMAVRNSISSGHNILSTIHADRASSIPMRMYSLLETSQEVEQFLTTIHRYVQIGIYVKGYFSKRLNRFQREIIEVCEFYVDDETQEARSNMIYKKDLDGHFVLHNPTKHLLDYMSIQNVILPNDTFGLGDKDEQTGDIETDGATDENSALVDTMDEYHKSSAKDLDAALNGQTVDDEVLNVVPEDIPQPNNQNVNNETIDNSINVNNIESENIVSNEVDTSNQENAEKNDSTTENNENDNNIESENIVSNEVDTSNQENVEKNDSTTENNENANNIESENTVSNEVNTSNHENVEKNDSTTENNENENNDEEEILRPKFTDPEMFNIMDFQDNEDESIEVL